VGARICIAFLNSWEPTRGGWALHGQRKGSMHGEIAHARFSRRSTKKSGLCGEKRALAPALKTTAACGFGLRSHKRTVCAADHSSAAASFVITTRPARSGCLSGQVADFTPADEAILEPSRLVHQPLPWSRFQPSSQAEKLSASSDSMRSKGAVFISQPTFAARPFRAVRVTAGVSRQYAWRLRVSAGSVCRINLASPHRDQLVT
jgi:hypothetical protein